MKALRIFITILIFTLITGCVGFSWSAPPNLSNTATPVQSSADDFATPLSLSNTKTLVPTQTPIPTPTQVVWSTDPHPLQIEVNRQWTYPGSEITFEETLPTRPTYDQFVVSYLSEGYKIYAYMAIPKGTKPETGWPSIILNHGYSNPTTYVTTEKYIAFMDVLSRSGYIVFKTDYRAHGKSEGPRPLGGGYGSPDYTVDVLNALASIKAYKDADPDRIGMVGHSMGGAITLRAMVVSKDIKAGVIWSGVVAPYSTLIYRWNRPITPTPVASDPTPLASTSSPTTVGFRGSVSSWASDIFSKYGSPDQNPAFWDSISPSAYIKDLSGPLQLQAATGDTQVPYTWSEELGKQLALAGMPYELYIYEKDNHNITDNFLIAIARTREFFDKYVKNTLPSV
jgi:dienelactone hydrolase